MEHVNGWCFRGIYKGDLSEDDLHVSAQKTTAIHTTVVHSELVDQFRESDLGCNTQYSMMT